MTLSDKQLIAWLERQQGINLVSDDAGNWAVSDMGMQPVPEDGGFKKEVAITSFVGPEQWVPTIREAINAAIKKQRQESEE